MGTTAPKEILTNPTASLTLPKSSLDSVLLENDEDVRGVVDYVHREYLRHPYPGPLKIQAILLRAEFLQTKALIEELMA